MNYIWDISKGDDGVITEVVYLALDSSKSLDVFHTFSFMCDFLMDLGRSSEEEIGVSGFLIHFEALGGTSCQNF